MNNFIRISKKLSFRICQGRYTVLEKYTRGYILNEEEINNFAGITTDMREALHKKRIDAEENGYIYALVAGSPCEVYRTDYRSISLFNPEECIKELL